MANFIGYKPEEVTSLMQLIANSYETVGSSMAEGWSTVSSTMQSNWHGTDEQDFEDKLAKRMNELYVSSTALVTGSLSAIKELADSWVEFQNMNRLQGGTESSVAAASYDFSVPTLKEYDMVNAVKLNVNSFSGESLGLVSNGGEAIKTSVETYRQDIEAKITGIYAGIDSSKAFLGTQNQKIDEFIVAVGEAIKVLSTDIDDMYVAIDTLTNTGYSTADSDAGSAMGTAASSVSSSVN
ncbi:MAG: hypothetical protein R3Y21_03160 [Mycoplasmatota bacterium]